MLHTSNPGMVLALFHPHEFKTAADGSEADLACTVVCKDLLQPC